VTASSAVELAYDAIAAEYDALLVPAAGFRERLWERFALLFPPGSRVLDVTAGTGLDAIHLHERGVAVTACDVSAGMLARLAEKAPAIPVHRADFNRLDEAAIAGPFDGLISTFAGINTAFDLSGLARSAARLVRPGGVVLLHVLARRWKPWRRTRIVQISGTAVPHRLWTPGELTRLFSPGFSRSRSVSTFGTFVTLELVRHG
jgi:demethylmenaquinone methyltransferase/2-methoxy-6-polyprenyl-1,4-benzoquinol methylase